MNIADRIEYLRKARGISQEELADQVGVSRQAVSKWESEQSLPEVDKIIILSDFFDVTTDYLLKGIEAAETSPANKVDANIFASAATFLNFIGLIVAAAVWHQQQTPWAIAIGFIFMGMGCLNFSIGVASAKQNVAHATRIFWTINIWLLTFMPLSLIYNALFSFTIAPYPLIRYGSALIALPVFVLVYIVLCLGVVFFQAKKRHK